MLLEKKSVVLCIGLLLFLIACDENSSAPSHSDFSDSSSSILQSSSSSTLPNGVSSFSQSSSSESIPTSSDGCIRSSSSRTVQSSSSSAISSSSSEAEILSSSSPTSSSSNAIVAVDPSTVVKGSFTDKRDGKVYKTVKIGEQTWMAENLNYSDSVNTPSLVGKSWCYENDSSYCKKYGRLYSWAAAIDSVALYDANGINCGYHYLCSALPDTVPGICPLGYHLPSWPEWKTLLSAIGGISNSGIILSTTGNLLMATDDWIPWASQKGTDDYGFSALPAGHYSGELGNFWYVRESTSFWTSTTAGTLYYSDAIHLNNRDRKASLVTPDRRNGFSIRCLMD